MRWQAGLASVADWLCHHQVPRSSSPAWHEGPSSHPRQVSNCLRVERGAVCFNKEKRHDWQSSTPQMSLFSLRSFQEHFLHEAGLSGRGDQWKCLGEVHGKNIPGARWCFRLGVDGPPQCGGFWEVPKRRASCTLGQGRSASPLPLAPPA